MPVEYTSVEVEYLEWAGKTIKEQKEQIAAMVEACKKALFLYEKGDYMFEGDPKAAAYAFQTKKELEQVIAQAEEDK